MNVSLFPLAEYWWLYLAFTGFVVVLLLVDLAVFHRKAHAVELREATIWSIVWVILSLGFALLLYEYALWRFPRDPRLMAISGFDPRAAARQVGLEFLTGYIVEKSLSMDNIFVFVVIFGYFGIPAKYQHRILFFGILGALVFRAIFIAIGSKLIEYEWVVLILGALLIITGIRMMFSPEREVHPDRNLLIRLFRKVVPATTELHGQRFFLYAGHTLYATPLFVALLFLELTDVVFAIDSVPAIFALTHEPLIVFTSNIFAILGLRAMYFLLAGAISKFYLLRYGLAVVLIFVGLKMVWLDAFYNGHFPILISLGVISATIATSIVLSVFLRRNDLRAEPGRRGERA
jgi:tellurite resistance protein TerC